MKTLERISHSPFDDPKIGLQQLMTFATDHLDRMRANNSDEADLSARIVVTEAAIDAVDAAHSADMVQFGVRKSKKLIKRRFRRQLRIESERVVAWVIGVFGRKAPQLKKVIPNGRTIFNTSPDDSLGGHLEAMKDGVVGLESDMGPQVGPLAVELATGLHDSWKEVHRESEEASGKKTATERIKNEAREALSWVLWENVMAISSMFPRQPEKIRLYFRQSLLEG